MKNQYAMNEQQVENLAADRTAGAISVEQFDGTYLRVLVTAAQAKLGKKTAGRPPRMDAQLTAFEEATAPFYQAVLRGVTTADIAMTDGLAPDEITRRTRERNRRSTFARTAKSTIVAWLREGGDLRALNPSTVTKTELRAAIQAAREARGDEPFENRILRAQEGILRAVSVAVAREGPEPVRAQLEAVIAKLQAALDELPDDEPTEAIRTRVGTPTFREPARVLNRPA